MKTMLANKRLWIGILFIGVLLLVRLSGIGDAINLQSIQEKRVALQAFVSEQYLLAVCAFIIWYIVIVSLALPLGALSTIAGGYVFGAVSTTFFANIGATIGSTFSFLLVRYAFGDALQERYKDRLARFNAELDAYGVFYLIAMRLIALVPLPIVNILIGLTNVPLRTFIWTTSLGIIPGTFVFAFAGKQLTTISSIADVFSLEILVAFGLLTLLALLPLIAKKMGWFGMKNNGDA